MSYLSPEEEFILLGARFTLDDDQKQRLLYLLKSPLRWETIFKMAMKNKVILLIFKHLNEEIFIPHVSESIKKDLNMYYFGNLARNLVLLRELNKFLSEFENAGIQAIILKGGFISHVLYEDVALRLMGDIDLLLKFEDLDRVGKIAEKLGYEFLKTRSSKELYEKYHFHYVYRKTDELKFIFEFHWNLIKSSMKLDIKPEELWKDTIEFNLFNTKGRTLSYENFFLHLIIHAGHDCVEHGLIALCEIAEFYKKFKMKINIPKFVNTTYNVKANKLAYYVLNQTEKFYGFKFDDHLVWQFKPHTISTYFLDKGFDIKVILMKDLINNLGIVYLTRLFIHDNPFHSFLLLYKIISPDEEYMMEIFQIDTTKTNLLERLKVFFLGLKLYFAIFKRSLKI
ncbi:nucleotidyltransferase family protein [bacterium]|nr:nucleotidyltransferase family protein [bacterium]